MNVLKRNSTPKKIVRNHRSTIFNLDRVKEMRQLFNGEYAVILHDGVELKLSRSRREQLKRLLDVGD